MAELLKTRPTTKNARMSEFWSTLHAQQFYTILPIHISDLGQRSGVTQPSSIESSWQWLREGSRRY